MINTENLLRNLDTDRWDRHSSKFTHLGKNYDIICLHEFLTETMDLGLIKFLNTVIQPEEWLVVVFWSTYVQERF